MPDIKTALEKALAKTATEWAADDAAHRKIEPMQDTTKPVHFAVTNNVCRATFEHIRDNPGRTRKEICKGLLAQGYKESSTTTLIGQMIKQFHVRESQGLLYATKDAYTPLKGSKAWAKLQGAAQRKKVTIVSKRTGEVINPVPKQTAPAPDTKSLLSTLNIVQARELYDELRKIFGDYHG